MTARIIRYLLRATNPHRTALTWWDLVEIALVALGFVLYFLVRGAVVDRADDALEHARALVRLQVALGIWVEPRLQPLVIRSDVMMRIMNFVYFWFDFPLIVGVGLLFFWRRRTSYTLLRDALLISGGFALILYWLFPVAPPRYLTEWGFVDTMERYSHLSYQAQSMRAFVNPFAAVPSLHVGWSVLLACIVFRTTGSWLARLGTLAVVALQALAVVATANHFIFDVVAGLLVSALALAVAFALQRRGYPRLRHALAAMERRVAALPATGHRSARS